MFCLLNQDPAALFDVSFLKSLCWHPGTRETSTDVPSVSSVFKVADIWSFGSPSLANLLISLSLLFFEYPFDIPSVGSKETWRNPSWDYQFFNFSGVCASSKNLRKAPQKNTTGKIGLKIGEVTIGDCPSCLTEDNHRQVSGRHTTMS